MLLGAQLQVIALGDLDTVSFRWDEFEHNSTDYMNMFLVYILQLRTIATSGINK